MFNLICRSALKNIFNDLLYTVINILGFSVSLSGFIFVVLFANYQLGFDKSNVNLNKIYALGGDYGSLKMMGGLNEVAPQFESQISEISTVTAVGSWYSNNEKLISFRNKRFYISDIVSADTNLLKVFNFPLQLGNPKYCLKTPNSIILSAYVRDLLFGKENPIGKVVRVDDALDLSVTGVLTEGKEPSNIVFQAAICSNQNLDTKLGLRAYSTYVLASRPIDTSVLNNKLTTAYRSFSESQMNSRPGSVDPTYKTHRIKAQPLKTANTEPLFNQSNTLKTITLYSTLSFLILFIAAINFINLSMAQTIKRSKEIGMNRLLGAPRQVIISRFLLESAIQVFISAIFAIVIVVVLLPIFNAKMNLHLRFLSQDAFGWIILKVFFVALLITIVASIYPALYISNINVSQIIKGSNASLHKSRKKTGAYFLGIQLTIAGTFICLVLMLFDQINLFLKANPGFNSAATISITTQKTLSDRNYNYAKHQLLNIDGVKTVTRTNTLPGQADLALLYNYKGVPLIASTTHADYDYFKTMGIAVVKGRDFSELHGKDSSASIVVNQSTERTLGVKDLLDKQFTLGNSKYIGHL